MSDPTDLPVPSPAVFVTCGDASTPRKALRSINHRRMKGEAESELAINYGSEVDSDDDEDGDEKGFSVPEFSQRVQLIFFEDLEQFAPLEQVTECKLEPTLEAALSPSSSIEPSHLLNFEWSKLPDPPVALTERREVFSEINCGPKSPFLTPYDAFIAIWDREFMEYIATETNRYAQEVVEKQIQEGSLGPSSRIMVWRNTDADELYVFFALVLATGVCVKADLSEYWTTGDLLSTPNFGQHISRHRFLLLSRCIHFSQNSSDFSKFSPPEAQLFKIAPVVDHLNAKFQSLYRLGQNITICESLCQYRWFDAKHIQSAVGIKTYEVCEAETGYLWRIKLHAKQEEVADTPVSGTIETLLLELLKGLEHKGHTVWMGNYYDSPSLARALKILGFDYVGPLRINRQGVTRPLATLKKTNMAIGQVSGYTSGDVDIIVWGDQKLVAMVSTYHGAAVHIANGIIKPAVIHDYNLCMSGVDKKDKMLSMYPIEWKRAHVWYTKFFRRLLNLSVLNSFILHKNSIIPNTHKRITSHRDFRKTLYTQLLDKHKARAVVPTSGATKTWVGGNRKIENVPIFKQEVLQHFPKEYGYIPGSTKKERLRRSCVVCKKRVQFYCPACEVPLCLGCSQTFHQ